MINERGDSYRFEIWQMALHKIADHPWIGHGFSADLTLDPGIGFNLMEPHSFALGVLYYVGIIGLLPWLFFLLKALCSWRTACNRCLSSLQPGWYLASEQA
jgi:O-antigen ligase